MDQPEKRCLETRTDLDGYRRRRYETLDGARYSTIEIPLEVWRKLVPRRKPCAMRQK